MKYITTIIFVLILNFGYSPEDFIKDDAPKEKEKKALTIFDNDRVVYGLNFDLKFWSGELLFNFSPKIGYLVTPEFLLGVGVEYQYYGVSTYQYNFNTHIYGASAFARYKVYKAFHVQAEVNALSLETQHFGQNLYSGDRFIYSGNYLGIAYKTPEEGKGGIVVSALWDFTYNENSPYMNPLVRIGYYF